MSVCEKRVCVWESGMRKRERGTRKREGGREEWSDSFAVRSPSLSDHRHDAVKWTLGFEWSKAVRFREQILFELLWSWFDWVLHSAYEMVTEWENFFWERVDMLRNVLK